MKSTADNHQMKIARSTLKMSITGARIMGEMTHSEAYKIIFGEDLRERLTYLLTEYPNATKEDWVSCELSAYGWDTAESWRELLESIQ